MDAAFVFLHSPSAKHVRVHRTNEKSYYFQRVAVAQKRLRVQIHGSAASMLGGRVCVLLVVAEYAVSDAERENVCVSSAALQKETEADVQRQTAAAAVQAKIAQSRVCV